MEDGTKPGGPDVAQRFVAGVATGHGGLFMSSAVKDTVTGAIFTISGNLEKAEEYARCCNEGMPNYLIPAWGTLRFRTMEEAFDGGDPATA